MRSNGTPCYIFDIDGTLANGDHRLHFIRDEPAPVNHDGPERLPFKPNWDAYFDACDGDTPHPHIITLCRDLQRLCSVIFISGRAERCREKTVVWLSHHLRKPESYTEENLFMRPDGDHRPDHILKIELLAEVRKRGYEPIMCFDDRNAVVKAWREAGVPCAQVAEGAF